MKITHTIQTVQNIAHCMLHISPKSADSPKQIFFMLNTFTRKTLSDLAKFLHIHRGTTTTRGELVRMINAKYTKLYCAAMRVQS